MNSIYIRRIYLDNFKLFDNFELDFSIGLNVFANYITYKYGKYNLQFRRWNLKEISSK